MKKTIHKVILIHIPLFLLIGLFHVKLIIVDNNIPENFQENIETNISKYITSDKEKKSNNNLENNIGDNKNKIYEIKNNSDKKILNNNIGENNSEIIIGDTADEIIYKKDIEIAFLGDVMIGSRVGDAMDKNGADYVYGGTKDYLSQKDAVILNLETTVTNREEKINKTYTFKAKTQHLEGIKQFNDTIVANLANNHIGDYKSEGVVDTINNLKNNDIEYFGAGINKAEADSVKIITVEGVKIALIGQTCVNPTSFGASETKAGNSRFDKDIILKEIKLSHENKVDIIVYNMHCGTEYTNGPNSIQKEYAHFAIDSGADLVIGHHPHRYQPIEIYKDKLIFYSLGDYIFDIFRGRRTQEGIIANIKISDNKIVGVEIIPTYTQGYGNTVISNKSKREFALNELYEISKKLGKIEGINEGYINLIKK